MVSTLKLQSTILIVLLLFSQLSLCFAESNSQNPTDREALLSIKTKITKDPTNTLSSWNESSPLCQWSGVHCNQDNRVSTLNLQTLGLTGYISPYIGNLSSLRYLYLQGNQLSGSLPDQLSHLKLLQIMNVSSNLIQGNIPLNITMCTDLTIMDLSVNRFSGQIPDVIGTLSKLEILNFAHNQLTGPIPRSIGNLSSLVTLNLGTNTLHGMIPDELGKLHKLEQLQLTLNNLTGTVPSSIYNLSALVNFNLASNELYGELPSNIGFLLPNLLIFHVCINSFTGEIPPSLHNITKVQSLRMSHNYLVGSVPPGLDKLHDLTMYNIGYNQLVGTLDFITSLTNSRNLTFLAADSNLFHGSIPPSIGNLSSTLSKIYLGGNQISGTIPNSVGQLRSLTLLSIGNNMISGEIPREISHLEQILELDLAKNNLTGKIPDALGNLSRITQLNLNENNLNGNIPTSFGAFDNLLLIDLSNNNLEGTIPNTIFTLTSLSSLLNLSHNYLTGPLPREIGLLGKIDVIDLSGNHLVGNIPDSIGQCESLQVLSLSDNLFSGNIPNAIGDLKALQSLDLSDNKLTGLIPDVLGELQSLEFLNLSNNDLRGTVPTEGVFKNQSALNLQGNPKLCLSFASCASHRKKSRVIIITVVSSISLALCFVIVLLFWALFMKKKGKDAKVSSMNNSIKATHKMVSYDEILKATRNFNPTCLIGTGSFGTVYKGNLWDGMIVAVKVLNLTIRGASKSFVAECEALRNVRHRNLVKLITLCSSLDFANDDFQALAYEFMENGSLEEWIRGRKRYENGEMLSVLERLNIAIDVACAMDYLHNDSSGTIVHCDLKPSNILLDKEMCAKVSDFGLAKLLFNSSGETETISSTGGLRGSIGYIPPEYGFGGKPSTKGDVYSYGVMLLELVTGKSPTDELFVGGLSLEKWVRAAFPDEVEKLVDPALCTKGHTCSPELSLESQMKCMVSMARVGLSCTIDTPDTRCTMQDALHELKSVKKILLQSL
ncbi:Receptor-like protein kinase [Rhynchospora pubera]|uniref:Receptor kinase-like protein Xa21 n=1 Tax=Rhynchospora pubera TaxID=906938 RepID=A0AAV8G5H2_9POAL|nr:Receptor-like protein kinase [Rhynchospora pubera]